jgi:hypothetical protein
MLFTAALVHAFFTVFYFAAVAGGRSNTEVLTNSIYLYLAAVVIGAISVIMSNRHTVGESLAG